MQNVHFLRDITGNDFNKEKPPKTGAHEECLTSQERQRHPFRIP